MMEEERWKSEMVEQLFGGVLRELLELEFKRGGLQGYGLASMLAFKLTSDNLELS